MFPAFRTQVLTTQPNLQGLGITLQQMQTMKAQAGWKEAYNKAKSPSTLPVVGDASGKLKEVLLREPALLRLRNTMRDLAVQYNTLWKNKKFPKANQIPVIQDWSRKRLNIKRQYEEAKKLYKEAEKIALSRFTKEIRYKGYYITITGSEGGAETYTVKTPDGDVVGSYPTKEAAIAIIDETETAKMEQEQQEWRETGKEAEVTEAIDEIAQAAAVKQEAGQPLTLQEKQALAATGQLKTGGGLAKPLLIGGAAVAAFMLLK